MSKLGPGHHNMVSVVLENPLVKFSNSSWEEQVSRAPSVPTVPHTRLYFAQYQYCLGQYLLVCALSPVALQIKQVRYMISELDTLSYHYMDSLTDVPRYRRHTRQSLSFGLRSQVEGPMSSSRQERSVYLVVIGKDDS